MSKLDYDGETVHLWAVERDSDVLIRQHEDLGLILRALWAEGTHSAIGRQSQAVSWGSIVNQPIPIGECWLVRDTDSENPNPNKKQQE